MDKLLYRPKEAAAARARERERIGREETWMN